MKILCLLLLIYSNLYTLSVFEGSDNFIILERLNGSKCYNYFYHTVVIIQPQLKGELIWAKYASAANCDAINNIDDLYSQNNKISYFRGIKHGFIFIEEKNNNNKLLKIISLRSHQLVFSIPIYDENAKIKAHWLYLWVNAKQKNNCEVNQQSIEQIVIKLQEKPLNFYTTGVKRCYSLRY